MKNIYFLFSFNLTIMSCENSLKNYNYKEFDFSYNNTFSTCFSIKFTSTDTVFIRQHWAPSIDEKEILRSNTNYFAIISKQDKLKFDSLLNKINFTNLDTIYYQDYSDGAEYKFYYKDGLVNKTIYIHSYSDSISKDIKNLAYWIVNLKEELDLNVINSTIKFGSIDNFLPPPPPTPPNLDKNIIDK